MALIKERKGRKDGGYGRLFGNVELGELISKVQAAVISAGTELEKMIKSEVEQVEDLDAFFEQEIMHDGVFMANKRLMKNSKKLDFAGSEPDFVVFRRRDNKQHCYLIELKDGDTFDTKKSAGERNSMHSFISKNAQHLPYTVSAHFCCFNQVNRDEIIRGFKDKITKNEAMTGPEFCELLEIDYDKVIETRKADQPENLLYFVQELLGIKDVRELIDQHRD